MINKLFENFSRKAANIHVFSSLGQIRYISTLYEIKFMIGNSSSGIFESPFVKLPVINIGNRQLGRQYTKNILLSNGSTSSLKECVKKVLADKFKASLEDLENPYGDGHASERIVSKIKEILYA